MQVKLPALKRLMKGTVGPGVGFDNLHQQVDFGQVPLHDRHPLRWPLAGANEPQALATR
jgi:hypothetical protein